MLGYDQVIPALMVGYLIRNQYPSILAGIEPIGGAGLSRNVLESGRNFPASFLIPTDGFVGPASASHGEEFIFQPMARVQLETRSHQRI